MRRALLPLCCVLGLLPASAVAQGFEKICLPQEDAGDGLSLAVDRRNRLHLARISRLTGSLLHTTVHADGQIADAQVVAGVTLLALNEVDDTQILVEGDRPRICYHHAVSNAFEVAIQTPQGWQREVVHRGVGAGRWCTLRAWRRTMVSVFGSDDGRLRMAMRRGPNDWEVSIIDEADEAVGREVTLTEIGGALVAAHRTESNLLRISWQLADGWQSQPLLGLALEAGAAPVALAGDDGALRVVHGTPGPPGTSDGGLMLTTGHLGMFDTITISDEETGGSNGAIWLNGAVALTTRLFRRNAVFGNADGLRYYRSAQIGFFDTLEAANSAERRRVFRNIDMAPDAFGLPLIGTLEEAGRFQDMRGTAFTCIWRPRDLDQDGIPNDAEARYNTLPDNPDTDGDGRLDGEEVLVHETNPLVPDPPPPDMGLLPDLGIADFGIADLDMAGDGGEGPDGDVAADMASVDGAPPGDGGADRGLLDDAARGDGAVGDATSGDGAIGDATPDLRVPPPADRGLRVDAGDADVIGYEAIRPPKLDGGTVSGGSGGSDGCAQAPGRSARGWWALALVGLGLRRRRRA